MLALERMSRTPPLPSLLPGSPRQPRVPVIWRGVRVEVGPEIEPPFAVDALVVEDDTWLVLAAETEFRPEVGHPMRIMTELHEAEPVAPGTVVVHDGFPVRLHAIVHDVDRDPTWTEEWISAAVAETLGIAGERGFRSLGVPLLGTRHGRLDPSRSLELIDRALGAGRPAALRRIWLIVP